ncbi:MAG: hypothetical protein C0475_01060 [Planctomyces sp.]|nr:hypothetical protein [Planctomyces sp.]MBA4039558.1 hypothetical protein [Planctomyces sp.]MBA4120313.1 hypothetical protein [Isosphaera sp.]
MPAMLDVPAHLLPLQSRLADAAAAVHLRLARELASDIPAVNRLCRHLERYHGKMLRPALVFLCGWAAAAPEAPAGPPPEADLPIADPHLGLATVCEMIHVATLVHDDVLDDADTRRGGVTVNALRGNEAAVILGDFLFSAAYRLCSSLGDPDAAVAIAQCGMTLCAGELLQLDHRLDYSIPEDTYFGIVERKTASLIATACRLGARASGAPAAVQDALHRFGLRLGVAFQIQDDLLDLTGLQSVVGKPMGKDVEKGKLTLPLIHHLAAAQPERRARTLRLIDDMTPQPPQAPLPTQAHADAPPHLDALRAAMRQTDSIAHARAVAADLVERAKADLAALPDNAPRRLLAVMADAVITRAV